MKNQAGNSCWVDLQAGFVNYGQQPAKYLMKYELISQENSGLKQEQARG